MGVVRMTLQQIEYFLSCATLLNFRKSAQLHYISPSTLTRHIFALEQELGSSLFQRDTHQVHLTDAGWHFFHCAYRMLTEYQRFYEQTNMAGLKLQRQGNPFLIGSYAFDGMYGELVDRILALPDYFLDRPIKIDFIDAGNMIPSVIKGDIQIGIDSEVHVRKYGSLFATKSLQAVPFQAAVGPEHPLTRKRLIYPEELYCYFTDSATLPLGGSTYPQKISFPICSVDTLRKMGEFNIETLPDLFPVLSNDAIGTKVVAILPKTLTASRTGELHRVEIVGKSCWTNYVLFWLAENANPDIQRFIDWI